MGGKQQHIVKGSSQSTDVLPSALRGAGHSRFPRQQNVAKCFRFQIPWKIHRFRLFQVKPGQPKKTHFLGLVFCETQNVLDTLAGIFQIFCEEVTAKLLIQYNHIQT